MRRCIDAIKLKSDMMEAIRLGYNAEDMLSIVDEQPDVGVVGKEIKKKVFCEECRKDVCYIEETVPKIGIIRNKKYRYIGRDTYCEDCGSQVFVEEIMDANLSALYDAYCQNHVIEEQPNVDVVEVVRCKDCVHKKTREYCNAVTLVWKKFLFCNRRKMYVTSDFFCADGDKRRG